MAFITLPFPTFTVDTVIDPTQTNANNAAIIAQVNGSLDNTNISTSAAISLTKLGLAPGAVALNKNTTGAQTWGSALTTDTTAQIAMTSDAGLQFGPGGVVAPDVALIRSALNTLKLQIPGGAAATLDMNGGTISNFVLGGTVPVNKGGTGATTLTGALVGNGTSAITAGTLSVANGGTGTTLFTHGQATFATSGSVAVVDATITAGSIIVVTEVGTSAADHYSVAVNAGVGFTIYSSNASSTKTVNYVRLL